MSETPAPSTPSRGEALSSNTTGENTAASAHAGARRSAEPADRSAERARSGAASNDSSATPTSGIEAPTHQLATRARGVGTPAHGVGSGAQASATPTGGVTAPARQSATPPPTSSDEQRPRAVRSERKTLRIRIPDGWARSLLAGVEAALLGWALSTTLVLVTYLGVSDNPWMGKISWDDAMSVGSDLWAMSLGSPLTVNEVTYRAVPLLMTLLAVVILRLLLFTGRHFPASALWFAVPAYMGTTALLVGSNTTHHHWPATMIGAFVCSMLATVWAALGQTRASYRKVCALARETGTAIAEPPRILQIPNWLRIGLRQGAAMMGIVVGTSLIVLMAAVVKRWENVVAIADLLQPATFVDTTMLAIGQALFVPTAGAWVAAWGAGPGIVLGPNTVHSLTSAPTAPIPPVPFLGALPVEPVGAWMLVVPLAVGVMVGALFVWRGRLSSLREQTYALGVAGGVFALFMAAWMWLSILTLGQGRLVGIGPRLEWALPALLGEILGMVALVVLLSHPTTRAWLQGRRADAHEVLVSSGLGQKIRFSRGGNESEVGLGKDAASGVGEVHEDSSGMSTSEALSPDDIPTTVFSITDTKDTENADKDVETSESEHTTEETVIDSAEAARKDTASDITAVNDSTLNSEQAPSTGGVDTTTVDTTTVDTGSLYATTRGPRPASDADSIPTTRIPRIEDPSDD